MARPHVYTNEQIISALVEMKGLVFLAAKRIGCDPGTIYHRIKRSPAVAAAIRAQRGELVDTAELSLYNAILRGEGWAVALTLKTLGKDRGYVESTILEGGDKPVVVIDWDTLVRRTENPPQPVGPVDEVEDRLRKEEALPAVAPPLPNGLKEIGGEEGR